MSGFEPLQKYHVIIRQQLALSSQFYRKSRFFTENKMCSCTEDWFLLDVHCFQFMGMDLQCYIK